jgi:hypothetical protein
MKIIANLPRLYPQAFCTTMATPCSPDGARTAPWFQRGHGWLCLGPIILTLLDYGMTLAGQPAAYWAGNYLCVREGSALLRWCLHQHPLVFVVVATAVTGVYCLLIMHWPRRAAHALAAWLMGTHAFGVATWVFGSMILGPAACVAILYFCWSVLNTTAAKLRSADRLQLAANPS